MISKIYSSKKYYLIIISNSIKIPNIPEVELLYHEDTLYDEDKLFYGNYQIINEIESIDSKKQILHYMYYETITNAILNNFSIKNLESYLQVMVRLSKLQEPVSLRKLHAKLLERGVDISLITMIDYVEYSLQAKLIHRVYPYDIKLQKHIKAKAKYYFYDTGIRNTINCFSTNIQILKENYILSHLHSLGYSISSGINGRFSWTLVIHKDSIKNPENILFHIHVSKQNTKKEIKKEINKLNKI
ncbi:MAG: hypothetical protein H6767_03020 [Candidatus Peribacteria bacterium]|nr:MAG: hypothetical protein H6767_03020 [Candidatus Peribacteria bacterium]